MELHRTFSRLESIDEHRRAQMDEDYDNDARVQAYFRLEPIAEEKPTEDDIALLVEHTATPENVKLTMLMDLCTELEK